MVQILELRARVDAVGADQRHPQAAEGGQGLGPRTRAVQRRDELRPGVFTQRLRGHRGPQLGQHLPVLAKLESRVHQRVARLLAEPEQPVPRRQSGHVGQRWLAPLTERAAEHFGGLPWLPGV